MSFSPEQPVRTSPMFSYCSLDIVQTQNTHYLTQQPYKEHIVRKIYISAILLFMVCFQSFAQVEVSTRLMRALQNSNPNDYVKGIVYLRDQVDLQTLDARLYAEKALPETRSYEVITALMDKAAATQGPFIQYFEGKKGTREVFTYKTFWIANMIGIEARASVFNELMNNMAVAELDLDAETFLDKPLPGSPVGDGNTEAAEPGLKIINAHLLWAMGITGQGRLVMGEDTGVHGTHEAITSRWRGNFVPASQAWLDPAGGTTTPNDCDGHGTHTVGTMVGRNATDTIGVAPDAQWIAAKTICSGTSLTNHTAAFQWAMNPDGNPSTVTDIPDAINNSWYDPDATNECTGPYKQLFDAMEAVGIAVVFSAGNSGPNASTITKPKNINTNEVSIWTTGAIDGALYLGGNQNPIASFSSRGPSTCGGTGSLLIKPEASAPGVNVRSATRSSNTAYTQLSGTSMAAPHVAGAVALLKQAAPTLTGKQILLALYNTAKDLGTAGEDNTYGKGLIDVYAAFLTLGTPDTIPPATITDLAIVNPTSNALTLNWTVPSDTSQGGITGYRIKRSATPITDTLAFNNATDVPFTAQPKPIGQQEVLTVSNLNPATMYYFSVRARDMWGNWSNISNSPGLSTYMAPQINVTPTSISKTIYNAQTIVDTIRISNITAQPSTLNYNVELLNNSFPAELLNVRVIPVPKVSDRVIDPTVKDVNAPEEYGQAIEGQGGPDLGGYKWIDSDEASGPQYVWNDITATGTLADTWTPTGTYNAKDEGYAGPFTIQGGFKFYGQVKNQVYVSSNGVLLFAAPTANIITNPAIPNAATPNEFIAPFWDDLDGSSGGTVHYQQIGSTFVVQFTNWPKYANSGSAMTFQVHLFSSGKIRFYYNTMTGTLNSASVGIEDATGTIGLQTAYNAVYVKNNLAVEYKAEPDWMSTNHTSGTLYHGNTAALELTIRGEDFPLGNYSMDVKITSNASNNNTVVVPVNMQIVVIPVEMSALTATSVRNDVVLKWSTATETNNSGFSVERKGGNDKEFVSIGFVTGNGTTTSGKDYQFVDKNLKSGNYTYRLKQTDFDGTFKHTSELNVNVEMPTEFSLYQNYPNPFNPVTIFTYSLPEKSDVKLDIYNAVGEFVATAISGTQEAGYYRYEFDASKLTSGTYFYQIRATGSNGTFTETKKMMLVK